jgi:hypothetical protein
VAKVIQHRAPARPVPPARHVQLGLSADDVVGMYRTVLLARLRAAPAEHTVPVFP